MNQHHRAIERLSAHLAAYLGVWPPRADVEVVPSPQRRMPSWDGSQVAAVVVASPDGTVISVPPESASASVPLAEAVDSDSFRARLAEAVGAPGRASPWLVLRWTGNPAPLPAAGEWMPANHPALPGWLHAFPSPVLAMVDDDGAYLAGVGIKPHSRWGRELAVGTDETARGRGLGRRLVAHAGRAVLDDGAVPLYVHHPDNEASARVADAAGFPDLGWRMVVVMAPEAGV